MFKFNLYNATGAQIGVATTSILNLEANGVWRFEAFCFEDNFKTAKFKKLTGY